MNELGNLIKEKTGCSDEQAARTIEVVAGYLKERVPASFQGEIDNMLAGKKLGEDFKKKISVAATEFRDKAEDVIQEVRDKITDFIGKKEEPKK